VPISRLAPTTTRKQAARCLVRMDFRHPTPSGPTRRRRREIPAELPEPGGRLRVSGQAAWLCQRGAPEVAARCVGFCGFDDRSGPNFGRFAEGTTQPQEETEEPGRLAAQVGAQKPRAYAVDRDAPITYALGELGREQDVVQLRQVVDLEWSEGAFGLKV